MQYFTSHLETWILTVPFLLQKTKLINKDFSARVNKVALSIILVSETDKFPVKPYFSYIACQI